MGRKCYISLNESSQPISSRAASRDLSYLFKLEAWRGRVKIAPVEFSRIQVYVFPLPFIFFPWLDVQFLLGLRCLWCCLGHLRSKKIVSFQLLPVIRSRIWVRRITWIKTPLIFLVSIEITLKSVRWTGKKWFCSSIAVAKVDEPTKVICSPYFIQTCFRKIWKPNDWNNKTVSFAKIWKPPMQHFG